MKIFTSNALVPFAAMVFVQFSNMVMASLSKTVMRNGMSKLVYISCFTSLGAFVLLPCFVLHRTREKRPPITFSLLCRLFVLGLLGIFLATVLGLVGINYSSPTLAAAIGNLVPVFTFLLAIISRMEKLDLRSPGSQAKSLGTILALLGALFVILYKGPELNFLASSSPSSNSFHSVLHDTSNWVIGGAFITVASLLVATWNILQAATVKEYPDKTTIVFFYSLFGAIQCTAFALISERNSKAWKLHNGMEMFSVLFSAIFGTVLHSSIVTWCLEKKGPIYVSMFMPLSIVIAVIIGVAFLGETLHLGSVIGAIVIVVGFYAVMWGLAKEKETVPDFICGSESLLLNFTSLSAKEPAERRNER